ncbi:hypothetical protein R1sor_017197 [Riccia sorocarpa]|uniref:Uncharacterized protein n=1 Tax=Riccia sorocarpa TaxID=122646 RepID=A0ABD3I9Q8_9MARC
MARHQRRNPSQQRTPVQVSVESKETTKEVTKEKGRKKKDSSDDETGQGSQQQPASNDAMEVQPDSATPTVDEDQPEPAVARKEGRQRKRAKKQSDGVRVYECLFRTDQFIDIPNQFVVLKGSLKSTYDTLQGNKMRARKMPVPIIDELKKMCIAIAPMRMSGFILNGKQTFFAADCLYLDLPSGFNLEVDDVGPPLWNRTPGAVIYNYNTIAPKKLDDLGRQKCTGFVQTLLENFTKQGDIVIDFAGGWKATLHATFNCSRCCIVAEERHEAYDNMQLTLAIIAKAKENLTPESSSQPVSQPAIRSTRGKKPLGEDDYLVDNIFRDDE